MPMADIGTTPRAGEHTMTRAMTTPDLFQRSATPSSSGTTAANENESSAENLSSPNIEHLEVQFARAKQLTRAATAVFEACRSPRDDKSASNNQEMPNRAEGTPSAGTNSVPTAQDSVQSLTAQLADVERKLRYAQESEREISELKETLEKNVAQRTPPREKLAGILQGLDEENMEIMPFSDAMAAEEQIFPTEQDVAIFGSQEVATLSGPSSESSELDSQEHEHEPVKVQKIVIGDDLRRQSQDSMAQTDAQDGEVAARQTGGLSALAVLASPARASRCCEERISLALLSLCCKTELNSMPVLVPGN